jgi:hypothetical protein
MGSGLISADGNDPQRALLDAIEIHEPLQRQAILVLPSSGNHGLADLHGISL